MMNIELLEWIHFSPTSQWYQKN